MSSQRVGKYACLETERRYLLKTIPDDVPESPPGWLIVDCYFPNTRLRLRKMQSLSGSENIYKLTQKYRSETQDADETTITNLYLTEKEYHFLVALEAKMIRKKRYRYHAQNHDFSLDVFEGRHQGLILAEMEFEKKVGIAEPGIPSFAMKDVTDDSFFTGGNLVSITDEAFRQGLRQRMGEL